MSDLIKVKERIAKLLAKANNNSNEHEAELAAARARKLMDQHQLDEMDIAASADESQFAVGLADEAYAYCPEWRQWIATVVAQYNDCQCRNMFVEAKKGNRAPKRVLLWRGFRDDVQLAKQMYYYLCDVIDNATSKHQKALGITRYNARLGTIFKEAMARRIYNRLRDLAAERKAEMTTSSGTALAIYKENQVSAHFGEVTYTSSKKDMDFEEATMEEKMAYLSGDIAGQEAAITTVLENK